MNLNSKEESIETHLFHAVCLPFFLDDVSKAKDLV